MPCTGLPVFCVSVSRCDFSTMKVVEAGSELGSRGGGGGGPSPRSWGWGRLPSVSEPRLLGSLQRVPAPLTAPAQLSGPPGHFCLFIQKWGPCGQQACIPPLIFPWTQAGRRGTAQPPHANSFALFTEEETEAQDGGGGVSSDLLKVTPSVVERPPGAVDGSGRRAVAGLGSSSRWAFPPPPCGCSHRVLPPGEAESPAPKSDTRPGLRVPALRAHQGCRARAGKLCS